MLGDYVLLYCSSFLAPTRDPDKAIQSLIRAHQGLKIVLMQDLQEVCPLCLCPTCRISLHLCNTMGLKPCQVRIKHGILFQTSSTAHFTVPFRTTVVA